MEFTIRLLKSLRDSGKPVCIYSAYISNVLNDYNLNSFDNFSTRLYYYWRDGEKGIPLEVVTKIMKDKNLNKLEIDFFSMSGGNKIKFPKDKNLNFCYLLGLILGDGCLVHRKRGLNSNSYSIQITFKEEDNARRVGLLINRLFDIKYYIYKGVGNWFNLIINSKPIVLILSKKYQIPIGLKYSSICVPELILNGDKNMKISFLKGVFESDGNSYNYRKGLAVQLRQKSERFLKEIKELFNQININFRDPYYDKANNSWVIWSSKKSLVDNFIKQIIDFRIMPL